VTTLKTFGWAVALVAVLSVIAFGGWCVGVEYKLPDTSVLKATTNVLSIDRSDDPPLSVNINGERWMLVGYDFEGNGDSAHAGVTECDRRIIFYDTGRYYPAVFMRDVLWHEVGHALRCGNPYSEMSAHWSSSVLGDKEHEAVYELGMGMAPFVHDNPDFVKWAENWPRVK